MQPSVRRRRPIAILVALVLLITAITPAVGASPSSGFSTDRPAMLDPVADDVTVKALISVGEMVGSYRFESLPDGIAIWPRDRERVDLYVNHETSKVPFQGVTDYRNSEVSHLVIKRGNGKVLSGDLVVPSGLGYQRFCSNFIAGPEAGFANPLLLTNEEATDFVMRQEASWPVPAGQTGEQAGMVVAVDLKTGAVKSITGMGRHNHENAVAIPGYDQAVVVSGDDTFSAPSSQFYMYLAPDGDAVWNDTGHLWAFQAAPPDAPGAATENDYGDITAGESIDGHSSWSQTPSLMAGRPASRTGRTTITSSNSSASRTSPTTASIPMSSTSPTQASPVPPTAPRLARASAERSQALAATT